MKQMAAAILVATVCYSPAWGSTAELSKSLTLALGLSNQTTMPADERMALVEAAIRYWQNFNDRIPRNSPADAAWLKAEMGTTDTERIGRVISTSQYALMRLVDMSEQCLGTHRLLATHVGGDKATEMYLWLKAAPCYADRGAVHYLAQADLSDGTYDGAFKMATFGIVFDQITGKIANSVYSGD